MSVKVEKLDKSMAKLIIEVSAEDFEKAVEKHKLIAMARTICFCLFVNKQTILIMVAEWVLLILVK